MPRASIRHAIAAGGRTLAVIGTPLDQFYPSGNRALHEQLMREQLVVSQFPSGYPVKPKNFPIRNRIMALLSDGNSQLLWPEKMIHYGAQVLSRSNVDAALSDIPAVTQGSDGDFAQFL